ncbi:methyl-accepting chemotaxis protein [Desulfosarcina ovata subsp. sediminis]|uniref:Methyl-accepting chemotaxis protein n=1 Tax=Desulfosarcina ovata subsp. sediminis TaxID=885957 RepID=A0A5K7ZPR7_9BACT|nr:HAMP domain-containing methyl-accepting chemotaxis protein [Desulfosarcina ovata]BBO81060.1 methyl-accepting chemotaxis protein [Desulfosarcina ovata subsp. sediminis]
MWKKMSIAKKIWLGVSILIVGYLISMLFGFLLGRQSESQLVRVSQSSFPASQQSQAALTAFKEQVKLYNDAVMLGDSALIHAAGEKSAEVMAALDKIVSLDGISDRAKTDTKAVEELVVSFSKEATGVYTAMVADTMSESLGKKAAALSQTTEQIRSELSVHTQTFADSLKSELARIGNTTRLQRYLSLIIFVCVVSTALICVSLIIIFSVNRPLKSTVAMLKDIAEGEGDLTRRLSVKSNDEVGELSHWFNVFMEKMQGMLKSIANDARTLKQSSEQLFELSGQLSNGADNVSVKSEAVAAASDQMSSNMNSVAVAMEDASANVNMVATATEEMTSTVNEIAHNSEKAKLVTENAVNQADRASKRVCELGNAAQDIGRVAETITEISEQTNLLALNATIEAARAGESGKGFAVVANEIKDLARQTAAATLEIKEQIAGIQGSTEGTVSEIKHITKVINGVNEIVSSIATAVEEQSAATREISGNVSHTAQGLEEINGNVSQSSTVALEIAKDIATVNTAANDMTENSSQVNSKAEALRTLAEQLTNMVGRFKL